MTGHRISDAPLFCIAALFESALFVFHGRNAIAFAKGFDKIAHAREPRVQRDLDDLFIGQDELFGGRNWEYYGEDGYLSGKLAAEQIKGLREKGVIPYLKHFAVNEQETTRNAGGLVTWVTEQAMREIYLRPFEIAVKEGKTNGMMSSFNRIGTRWAGGDYRLLTEVLRDEWGFRGAVICDYDSATPYMDNRQMASAGGDLTLGTDQSAFWRDFDAGNAEDVAILRNATKNILYATANSTGVLVSVRTGIAKWQILLYVLDAVIPAGLVVWGVFAIIKAYKKPKEEET